MVSPTVRFLGAARTVTGSRFLVETDRARVLVDCGMFQGEKELRLRNWAGFPVDPETIDAVVVTHAHLDHVGYVPALVKQGFAGPIYSTPSTGRLARIVLEDSGRLHEADAERANRKGYTRHDPALPLYTEADATTAIARFTALEFDQTMEIAPTSPSGLAVPVTSSARPGRPWPSTTPRCASPVTWAVPFIPSCSPRIRHPPPRRSWWSRPMAMRSTWRRTAPPSWAG